ncbi:MAG: HAD family hydrolase [Lachnospiraceae bacterium]|nr:HAD family hydrolase [Lachnospiraceae bacterium]
MIKLIASDVDGTLLTSYVDKIKPDVIECIRQLKTQGVLFCAASGRQYANLARTFHEVKDDIAYICENGTLIVKDGSPIFKAELPDDIVFDILKTAGTRPGLKLLISGEHHSYIQDDPDFYDFLTNTVGNDVVRVPDILVKKDAYLKMSLLVEAGVGEIYDREFEWWHQRYGDRVTVVRAGIGWIDVMPQGLNKGSALRRLMALQDAAPDEVMTFGDNYNDEEMLTLTPHSYAMDNAPEPVKAMAAHTCPDVGQILKTLL